MLDDVLLTVYTNQMCKRKEVGPCDLLQDPEGMLSLRSCLVDDERMLLFTVKQIFLPMEEV